jgi:hypothetical protein
MPRPAPILSWALAAACLCQPALAQSAQPDEELRAFVARYVDAFNKGDAAALAADFYQLPGVDQGAQQARLAQQFEALRADSFGRMTLYGARPCVHGAASAEVQVDFAYNYTFGGVMDPPGDQSSVFRMRKTDDGWRIVATNDLEAGQSMVCAQ